MNMQALWVSLESSWKAVGPYMVKGIGFLLLLLVGWLVAKGIQWAVVWGLKALKLDEGARKVSFDSVLRKAELKMTASELVGVVIYWAALLMLFIYAAGFFRHPAAALTREVLRYIVINVGSAVFVLVLTAVLGTFIANTISVLGRIINLPAVRPLSKISYYIVIVFGFMVSLGRLGVETRGITEHIDLLIGGVALAAAIAFGLGCKDIAASFFDNIFKERER